MPIEEHTALIQRFVAGFSQGDLSIIDETISPSFYGYDPAPGEETAPEVLRKLAGDLVAAFPDMKIAVDNFNDGGETLSFTLTLSGTQKNELWGSPGSGKQVIYGLFCESVVGAAPAAIDGLLHLGYEELVHAVEIGLDGMVYFVQSHAVRILPLPL